MHPMGELFLDNAGNRYHLVETGVHKNYAVNNFNQSLRPKVFLWATGSSTKSTRLTP